jgi:hypothetical protein
MIHSSELNDYMTGIINELPKLPHTSVGLIKDGITICLYVKGKRPTRFTLKFQYDRYGNCGYCKLDMITCFMDEHRIKKTESIPCTSRNYIIKRLTELLNLPCDGSLKDTLENFEPIGLLWRSK